MRKTGEPTTELVSVLLYLTTCSRVPNDPAVLHRGLEIARSLCPRLEVLKFGGERSDSKWQVFHRAMKALEETGFLSESSGNESYIIGPEARRYVENWVLPRFSSRELVELARAADAFVEVCSKEDLTTSRV